MGKWSFDVIFEGDVKDQLCKASHLVTGLRRLKAKLEEKFAAATLSGEVNNSAYYLKQIHDIEEAQNAFIDDPRTVVLQEKVNTESEVERKKKPDELARNPVEQLVR